jgi:AraC-like DNA-binding protein
MSGLGKMAVESQSNPTQRADKPAPAQLDRKMLARGPGWSVSHVACELGPHDGAHEEQHSQTCIAIVKGGSFQYRSQAGRELMTPGSLLLGNPEQSVEYRHDHASGDRCISFSYEPAYFEAVAADAGVQARSSRFSSLSVPPVRELSGLIARACALDHRGSLLSVTEKPARRVSEHSGTADLVVSQWEEIGFELAARALQLASANEPSQKPLPAAEARITRIVRLMNSHPDGEQPLDELARGAKLSRYHFLRLFQQLTGLTPHRYLLRIRLRRAATQLLLEPARVLDVALDSGFGDVSNFNHAFRAEFGVSPRSYRKNRSPLQGSATSRPGSNDS